MSLLWAVIFGIIQGATEFLPVSSSAHLTILGAISKIKEEDALPFFLVLHLGTLISLIAFFFKDLLSLGKNLLKKEKESIRTLLLICTTTLITGILGLGLKKEVETAFASSLWPSIFLIVTSLILFSSLFLKKRDNQTSTVASMTFFSAFLIGLAQGIAVFPGISRSGITTVAALFVGLSRKEAFNYSFLVSIPAIAGAFLLNLRDIERISQALGLEILLVGFVVSFLVGYISLGFLKSLVIQGKLHYFGFYTLFASVFGFLVFYFF